MTGWTADDIRVASLLEAEFPSVHVVDVIHHERQNMTEAPYNETNPAPMDGPDPWEGESATAAPSFPELPSNPHNHVYTWSPKLPDGSMLVIRSNTAQGLVESVEAMAPLSGRLMAAWGNVTGRQTPATPPPFGANVSAPMAPGYQGPPQQAAPQWGAPQQPAFGGQQGGFGGGPGLPAGWFKLNVPFKDKAAFDAIVAQYSFRKGDPGRGGQVSWRKEQKFWACAPEVAQAFAQFSPVPA